MIRGKVFFLNLTKQSSTMKLKTIFALFLILHSSFLFQSKAQSLSLVEKKIIEHVKTNMPQTEKLLIDAVNINSGTLNHEGVRQVGQLFRKEFDAMGFTTEWISLPDSLRQRSRNKCFKKILHMLSVGERSRTPDFAPNKK